MKKDCVFIFPHQQLPPNTATLCCSETKIIFVFSSDEIEVSESCLSEIIGFTKTLKLRVWCWWKEHWEDVQHVPCGNFISAGSLWRREKDTEEQKNRGEEVVGSQVQCGGFHILLHFSWGSKILRKTHHRHRVVYVNHNLQTYHNKLQTWGRLLDLEMWWGKWQSGG